MRPGDGSVRVGVDTMPSYGPSRSAERTESGRTGNGARLDHRGPQAARRRRRAAAAHAAGACDARARLAARQPRGRSPELTDPSEVVIDRRTLVRSRGSRSVGSACPARLLSKDSAACKPLHMIKCVRCGNSQCRRGRLLPVLWDSADREPLPRSRCRRRVHRAPRLEPSTDRRPSRGRLRSRHGGGHPGATERGFRLVVVHRDGSDGIAYYLLGDQIDIGRTEGDLLFEDPHLAPRHARIVASLTGWVLTPARGPQRRLRAPARRRSTCKTATTSWSASRCCASSSLAEAEREPAPRASSTGWCCSAPRRARPGRGCARSPRRRHAATSTT